MNSITQFPFYAKASFIFIGSFAFISMMFLAQGIIVPVIYSTIIAIVMSPLVKFFVKRKINRVIAITITLVLAILSVFFIVGILSVQMMQFSDSFPKLVDKFHLMLEQSIVWVSDTFNISTRKVNGWVNEKNTDILNGTNAVIGQTIINAGSMLVGLVLIPVYVFMVLFYEPLLLEFVHRLFKTSKLSEVNEVITATKRIIQSYLVGLLLEAIIIAVLNSTALLILGIDYAILLGVIGALVNVIPYIGGIIAAGLPILIALATKSPSYALLVAAAYILIQFIDNHFIMPKVVASKVKINALISLIAVFAGGALWGVPGMFLAIPLTAIVKVIFDHIDGLKSWGYLLGNIMPGNKV